MKQNILALYLIKLSKWFSLVMPIIVLFYEDHGLGLQDVFILKSVYSVAAVTLEIPSGYLADVWGRKKCLILGCILFSTIQPYDIKKKNFICGMRDVSR